MNIAQPKTIVVPVDLSDLSRKALDTAIAIANGRSQIRAVHVLREIQTTDPGVVWQTIDNENRAKHAKEAIGQWLSSPYQHVELDIEFGDPGHQVADYAQRVSADLIVISSHGRTGIKRMLIGSVAERVIRLAHCPVLVIRD
jgi:nucleotide-binding universal stress UspA family protein